MPYGLVFGGDTANRWVTYQGDGITFNSTEANTKDNPQLIDFNRKKLADLSRFADKTAGSIVSTLKYAGLDETTGVYTLVSAQDIASIAGVSVPGYIKPTTIDMDNGTENTQVTPGSVTLESLATGDSTTIGPTSQTISGADGSVTDLSATGVYVRHPTSLANTGITSESLKITNSEGRELDIGFPHFDILNGLSQTTTAVDADIPNMQALCYDTTSAGNIPAYKTVKFKDSFSWLRPGMISNGNMQITPTKVSVQATSTVGSEMTSAGISVKNGVNSMTLHPNSLSITNSIGETTGIGYDNIGNLSRLSGTFLPLAGRLYNVVRSSTTQPLPLPLPNSTPLYVPN
jgi:hypothetical protein